MSSELDFFAIYKDDLLDTETCTLPNGKTITSALYRLPLEAVEHDECNIRFLPDVALTEEQHLKLIEEEDPVRSENLAKSLQSFPWLEPLLGYVPMGSAKAKIYGGSRRLLLSKKVGRTHVHMRIAIGAGADDIEVLRDWHEIFPTKVEHSKYAQNKAIYLALKDAPPEERDRKISKLKEKGLSGSAIEKGERTFKRLVSFAEQKGEHPSTRAQQWKAFEAYDQICLGPFEQLRSAGEYSRVETLNDLAHAYLDKKIAHDDIKVTLDYLSSVEASNPILGQLDRGEVNTSDVAELRRLTNEARSANDVGKPSAQVEAFNHRIFNKLASSPDSEEVQSVLERTRYALARYEALLNGMTGS